MQYTPRSEIISQHLPDTAGNLSQPETTINSDRLFRIEGAGYRVAAIVQDAKLLSSPSF